MSTKPTYAFYGKLFFNSDTQKHTAEMKPAVAQAVLKLNNVVQLALEFSLSRKPLQ